MVSRRMRWALGVGVAQIALLVATFPIPGFGAETWHHLASLGLVLLLALVLREPLTRSRRFLAIGVLATSVLASASGFYLLYWKAGLRAGGFQDWGVFWHVAWSWMVTVFAVQHTWINRIQLADFLERSFASTRAAVLHGGGYAILFAGLALTFSPAGRGWFTNETYYPLGLAAWVLVLVPAYGLWAYLRVRGHDPAWLARLGHWPLRRFVDLVLVPAAALAILSGFPLLFDGPFDARGLKYVTKTWHVWPSVVFSVLAFVHSVQAWDTVRVHWRRLR